MYNNVNDVEKLFKKTKKCVYLQSVNNCRDQFLYADFHDVLYLDSLPSSHPIRNRSKIKHIYSMLGTA